MVPLHEDDGSWMAVRSITISYGDDGDDILNLGWRAKIEWIDGNKTRLHFPTRAELYQRIEEVIGAKLCTVAPSVAR
jgi:hypothetical protein